MPSNQNRQRRPGLCTSNTALRVRGFNGLRWQTKRPAFEPFAPTEGWKKGRAEKVARAKALILAPDYPPEPVIQSIARLMADHWKI